MLRLRDSYRVCFALRGFFSNVIDLLIITNIGNSTMQVVNKANDPKVGVHLNRRCSKFNT